MVGEAMCLSSLFSFFVYTACKVAANIRSSQWFLLPQSNTLFVVTQPIEFETFEDHCSTEFDGVQLHLPAKQQQQDSSANAMPLKCDSCVQWFCMYSRTHSSIISFDVSPHTEICACDMHTDITQLALAPYLPLAIDYVYGLNSSVVRFKILS